MSEEMREIELDDYVQLLASNHCDEVQEVIATKTEAFITSLSHYYNYGQNKNDCLCTASAEIKQLKQELAKKEEEIKNVQALISVLKNTLVASGLVIKKFLERS